jgi:hypothetical protein
MTLESTGGNSQKGWGDGNSQKSAVQFLIMILLNFLKNRWLGFCLNMHCQEERWEKYWEIHTHIYHHLTYLPSYEESRRIWKMYSLGVEDCCCPGQKTRLDSPWTSVKAAGSSWEITHSRESQSCLKASLYNTESILLFSVWRPVKAFQFKSSDQTTLAGWFQ